MPTYKADSVSTESTGEHPGPTEPVTTEADWVPDAAPVRPVARKTARKTAAKKTAKK